MRGYINYNATTGRFDVVLNGEVIAEVSNYLDGEQAIEAKKREAA